MKLLSHYVENQKRIYRGPVNWQNHAINDSLFYAYRSTVYDRNTYPSSLHYHDYFELLVLEDGDISYVCESSVYIPKRGDVIIIPPGKFHMSKINSEKTHYKRHVFYLYPDAFDGLGHRILFDFLTRIDGGVILSLPNSDELLNNLTKLANALSRDSELDRAEALGIIIQAFCLLNKKDIKYGNESEKLPENVLEIGRYIDTHFAEINSVNDVAEHFFYSREYVSKLFKKHFNTTILDYVHKRRIAKSRELIADGVPIIEVCSEVGFGSLSTFIRVFRSITDMTPSEYRKMLYK